MGRYVGIGVRPAGRVGSNPVFPLLNLLNLKKIRRAYDRAWRIFTKFTYPTGNLDKKTALETLELLIESAKKFGQTLIIVTHDLEVARMSETVITIEDGRVIG